MKLTRQILLALFASLLLTAGFSKAAESLDATNMSPQSQRVADVIPGLSCTVR